MNEAAAARSGCGIFSLFGKNVDREPVAFGCIGVELPLKLYTLTLSVGEDCKRKWVRQRPAPPLSSKSTYVYNVHLAAERPNAEGGNDWGHYSGEFIADRKGSGYGTIEFAVRIKNIHKKRIPLDAHADTG